jgi:hypothetical protein
MIRRLFTLLSAVSLLLCVATCELWLRSYGGEQRLSLVVRGDRYTVRLNDGRVILVAPPPRVTLTTAPRECRRPAGRSPPLGRAKLAVPAGVPRR